MSEQVIRQVGKTRNVVGYTLWWLKFINYHLLTKNGAAVSRSHSCYWPFQPLGLLIWTLRLGLVMRQKQQEQALLKYNQTILWYKTQTEVGFIIMNVNENSITVKYCFGLEISVPLKKMLLLLYITLLANTAWNITKKKYRKLSTNLLVRPQFPLVLLKHHPRLCPFLPQT